MKYNRDPDLLELILEMITLLDRRLRDANLQLLIEDRDALDLSAFRLAVIGEAANKLTPELRARHPQISWAAMYKMRNVIAHDYGSIDPVQIWQTTQRDLEPLATVCRDELKRDT